MIYQLGVCFFPTKTMGIIKIYFEHCVEKYGPWYWITVYLLCRDQPAAARCYACSYLGTNEFKISSLLRAAQNTQYPHSIWVRILNTHTLKTYLLLSYRGQEVIKICCHCGLWHFYNEAPFKKWCTISFSIVIF